MPNAAAPIVAIELDKPRNILLNFNGLAAFEELTGKSALVDDLTMSATEMRALLWAGLLHEDPTLTVHDVGNLIHVNNLAMVTSKLNEAISRSLPEPDAESGNGGAA